MRFRMSISSTIAVVAMFFSSMCFAQVSLTEGGASGSWWNPTRDGEGIFVEIARTGEQLRLPSTPVVQACFLMHQPLKGLAPVGSTYLV
jgi:hypothetical protein